MYEKYSRQALPSSNYRQLLGSALCVFNSNNAFIIENILHLDNNKNNWYALIDKESGKIKNDVKDTLSKIDPNIETLFGQIIEKRNRIIHSFQVTHNGEQILCTKDRNNRQYIITSEYLLNFIKDNEKLSDKLYDIRNTIKELSVSE